MIKHWRPQVRRAQLGLVTVVTVIGGLIAFSGSSSADVTAVRGDAFGYSVPNLSIFGGAQTPVPPTPHVSLAPDASNSPQTAHADTGSIRFGPAQLFSSGPIDVSTQGSLGPGGSVTSTTDIHNINTSGQEVFTASRLQSTCTASESGVSGSTTVTGGTLQTSEGNPDVQGDETVVQIPTNPPPNYTVHGTLETVGDTFDFIFNEQVTNPDGSLTVTALHEKLNGPTAVGNVYIGQVTCGVTAQAGTSTTVPTSVTTVPTTVTTVPTTVTTVPTTVTTVPTTVTTVPTTVTTVPTTVTTVPTTVTTVPTTVTTVPTTVTTVPTTVTTVPTTVTTVPTTVTTVPTTTSTVVATTTTTVPPPPACNPPSGPISGRLVEIANRLPEFVRPILLAIARNLCLRGF